MHAHIIFKPNFMHCLQSKRSWCILRLRCLTCAEAVRTTKYIADNRVNIFKLSVPRRVRSSVLFSPGASLQTWDQCTRARLAFLLWLRGACGSANELWATKIARHQVIFPPFLITRLNGRGCDRSWCEIRRWRQCWGLVLRSSAVWIKDAWESDPDRIRVLMTRINLHLCFGDVVIS